MASYTLEQLERWTEGRIRKGDRHLSVPAISTDTRSLRSGEAFLAFRGEKFDGHSFVEKAIESGVAILVIETENNVPQSVLESAPAVLEVENTLEAWGDIAHHLRSNYDIPVLGITGSIGKTSSRGYILSVLGQRFNVLANEKNYNNLVGVPMTLMKIGPEHQWAALELGTDRPGEIERLTEIVSPTMALITGICPCHLEAFGDLDMVVEEKGSLLKGLAGEDPVSILAAESYGLERLRELSPGPVLTYGLDTGDYSATNVIVDDDGYASCFLSGNGVEIAVKLNILGAHQVKNALAGFVVGCLAGISPEAIKEGLENYQGEWGRLNKVFLNSGAVMLKDVYNANPDSTRAALNVLETINGQRKIAVLGDMLELGAESDEMHRGIGRFVAVKKFDLMVTVGERAQSIREEAGASDFQGEMEHFESNEDAARFIAPLLQEGDVVLLKASRSIAFEEIADYLESGVQNFGKREVGHV